MGLVVYVVAYILARLLLVHRRNGVESDPGAVALGVATVVIGTILYCIYLVSL